MLSTAGGDEFQRAAWVVTLSRTTVELPDSRSQGDVIFPHRSFNHSSINSFTLHSLVAPPCLFYQQPESTPAAGTPRTLGEPRSSTDISPKGAFMLQRPGEANS